MLHYQEPQDFDEKFHCTVYLCLCLLFYSNKSKNFPTYTKGCGSQAALDTYSLLQVFI